MKNSSTDPANYDFDKSQSLPPVVLTQEQRMMLARPMPAILPVGWTVEEYPATVEIRDHHGRFVHAVGKPYTPTSQVKVVIGMMNDIVAGKGMTPFKWL